ncbi:hypothetical protein [Psychrobacillus sp. FSL K6-1267]
MPTIVLPGFLLIISILAFIAVIALLIVFITTSRSQKDKRK